MKAMAVLQTDSKLEDKTVRNTADSETEICKGYDAEGL